MCAKCVCLLLKEDDSLKVEIDDIYYLNQENYLIFMSENDRMVRM